MIKPTVGRKVWYRPSQFDQSGEGMMVVYSDQPLDATIVAVVGAEVINLIVFDAVGTKFVRLSTPLMQEGVGSTAGGYAEWMPYQVGQAKKHEPQPPVANSHVAPGCEQFSEADIAAAAQHSFCFALEWLKAGKPVARAGWNGKGMFVYLVPANAYPAQTGVAKAFFGEGALVPYNAYLALKGVDGTVNTWVPSISDALAEDWQIVVAHQPV